MCKYGQDLLCNIKSHLYGLSEKIFFLTACLFFLVVSKGNSCVVFASIIQLSLFVCSA